MNQDRIKELRCIANRATCCTETTTLVVHELLDEIETLQTVLDNLPHLVQIEAENKELHVFCGMLQEYNRANRIAVLTDVRQCVWWSESTRGQAGLATIGPDEDCRVTPAAPRVEITGIVAVYDVTPAAALRWEAEPWNN